MTVATDQRCGGAGMEQWERLGGAAKTAMITENGEDGGAAVSVMHPITATCGGYRACPEPIFLVFPAAAMAL